MEILKDFSLIENEAYKNTAFNLKNELALKLPELVDSNNVKYEIHDDFMYIIVPFKKQTMAEKLTDFLNIKLKWNVLFAAKTDEGDTYKVLLYSTPVENYMLIATLDSAQYGIIEKITIRVFDSIEIMLYHLKELYGYAKKDKDLFILEEQKYVDVLETFIL